jgi:hypothetical protein
MTSEDLLGLIKSRGHWRTVIRPTRFKESLVEGLKDLEEAAHSSVVQLRGWDYPHWPRDGVIRKQDHIEGLTNWQDHKEIWRLYQSGQFAHLFALREDWLAENDGIRRMDIEPGRVLSYESTVFTVTEVFLFASRLAARLSMGPKVSVHVELHGIKGRNLHTFDFGRVDFSPNRRSNIEGFRYEVDLVPGELISDPKQLARPAVKRLFEQFNWDMSLESIAALQEKLLAGR